MTKLSAKAAEKLQQKVWDLKDQGLTSGEIAEELKMENKLDKVNVLFLKPRPMSHWAKQRILDTEAEFQRWM